MDWTGRTTEPPQLPPPPQAASPALISAVLGNDDILVRLDFPTCLVRAAAVSKRWLRHASDPAFLRRFRRLHPPRLLGFYVDSSVFGGLCFIPLPQPPELAAVIGRGNFDLGSGARNISCHNGRLIFQIMPDCQTTVCTPLLPGRGAMVLPPPQTHRLHDATLDIPSDWLFRDDVDDMSISLAMVEVFCIGMLAKVSLMNFQAGEWGGYRNSDMIQMPETKCGPLALLANGKIYVMCMEHYILGLDVQSMSLFSIKLPNGVECDKFGGNIALSRAEGSGFCLVHVKMFQISVWHYTYSSTGNWEMVDTISLPQVFGPNADPTWLSQGAIVDLAAVGDNADFVFLMIHENVFYLHISSRTVEKVYELAQDELLSGVSPFMMVWPPTFPSLVGGHDNDE